MKEKYRKAGCLFLALIFGIFGVVFVGKPILSTTEQLLLGCWIMLFFLLMENISRDEI